MADFIQPEEEAVEEPQTVKVGDSEFTQEELDELVGLGKFAKEVQSEQSIGDLRKIWSNHNKVIGEKKKLEEEIERIRAEAAKPKAQQQDLSVEDEVARAQALKAAKDLGILTKDELNDLGYVSKDDVRSAIREELAAEKLLGEAQALSREMDGSDGRPKFDPEEIITFMEETGIGDMNIAYKVKHEDALDTWRRNKVAEAKSQGTGFDTLKGAAPGASKNPEPIKVTRDNLKDLIGEGIEGKLL